MGGIQNLWKQHNPGVSKACRLNLERRKKSSAHQQSQSGILTFFTKQRKAVIPPTIPVPAPVIAYTMESTSQFSETHTMGTTPRTASSKSAPTNTHTIKILATLDKVVESLPLAVLPDASDSDEIAVFSGNVPTNLAKEEAWEYLDPMLNHFLGFDRTAASIYNELRGGVRGLSAMVRYLEDFVGHYELEGALLEGKIQRLINVIQTQCVRITRSRDQSVLTFDLYCAHAEAAAQARTIPMLSSSLSQMTMICNLKRRNKLSVSKSRKPPMHPMNRAPDTNSTSLRASRHKRHIHSPSIPSFRWPGTTAGAATAFSSSHTCAPALLEGMADASDVMTCVTMSISGRLLRDLQMAYTRTHQPSTMVLVALSTLYTGRHEESTLFAFVSSMT